MYKTSCPSCGSSDARVEYPDGGHHCFSCGDHGHGDDDYEQKEPMSKDPPTLAGFTASALKKRKIRKETCEKFGVVSGKDEFGEAVQAYPYFDEAGNIIAAKYRYANKDFRIVGNGKALPLFGKNLWKAGGKKIVVTEGELDALSMSQLQDNRWPVVSLPSGATAAAATVKQELTYLESFDEVILCFDMDEPGREAVEAVMPLLTPGRCKVMELPLKDVSDMLQAGRGKEVIDAMWAARVFTPEWFISGDEITYETMTKEGQKGYSTRYTALDEKTRGIRKGEVILFTGGTGSGKSTLCREISHHFMTEHELKIASVYLEESVQKTGTAYVALDHDLHLGNLRENKDLLSRKKWDQSLAWMQKQAAFVRHFGSLDSDDLMARLRFLAVGWDADFIVLDHVSIVVSGIDTQAGGGDVKALDLLMTNLATLSAETGVGVIVVAHLRKQSTGSKGHENGAQVTLDDLRGSGALKQIPDTIVSIERDQQAGEEAPGLVRVLKNREHSRTGPAGYVLYDMKTGRLNPTASPDDNPFPDDEEDTDAEY